MHTIRRFMMLATLAFSAFASSGASTSSAAIAVSNPGTLTASAPLDTNGIPWLNFSATLNGFPTDVKCTSSLTLSVSASGAVTVSAATFSSCYDNYGAGSTVTSPCPLGNCGWTAQIKGSTGAYRLAALGMRFTLTSPFATCAYNGGSITSDDRTSPWSSVSYSFAGPLTSTSVGCGTLSATGTYFLSKALSISGSL